MVDIKYVDNTNSDLTISKIVIEPELPIGTEFWIMKNDHPTMGLVSAFNVHVTSSYHRDLGIYEHIFLRWLKGTQKKVYEYYYSYQVHLKGEIMNYGLKKDKNIWWLDNKRIYFSLEELKAAL